ncbi:MAG: phosphoesterase [Clostridia bacterium]|nr:phosphoesterase [Clostridia bacterium]
MIDIHCHVLPGVDDGARDEKETNEMLARAADVGISSVICTPHVYHPENQVKNQRALRRSRDIAHANGVALSMGCEFNYSALAKVKDYELAPFCLAGTPCILLELSNDRLFPDWEFVLTEIAERGYMPIIAHPERYSYIQKDVAVAQALISFGCELQLDAGGLMAGLFSAERKTARKLLAEGMVSYIASDAHRPEHYRVFEKAYETFRHEWPKENQLLAQLALLRQRREKV